MADDEMFTPLHSAIYVAAADIVSQLISSGNVNKQTIRCTTPLHIATYENRWELVQLLLGKGADVNIVDDERQTPLHAAMDKDPPADIVTQLISKENINKQNRNDETPLHIVMYKKSWDLVLVLLDHGADVNMVDDDGYTPLHSAIVNHAPADLITELISGENVNKQNRNGETPLHIAMLKREFKLVPILNNQGADVNMVDNHSWTPLHIAIDYSDAPADIVNQLTSCENVNTQTASGQTPLHIATYENRWELVQLLLGQGADVNIVDDDSKTPLHVAIEKDATADIVTQLISKENINKQNRDDETPLHNVMYQEMYQESWELVLVLLDHGADVNMVDDVWHTPLHRAIVFDAPADIVIQMISKENINKLDINGETPLHLAMIKKWFEVVPILLDHGADPTMVEGFRPELSLQDLCIATIRRHMTVKTDKALEALELPWCLMPEMKMLGLAQQFIAWWKKRMVDDEIQT